MLREAPPPGSGDRDFLLPDLVSHMLLSPLEMLAGFVPSIVWRETGTGSGSNRGGVEGKESGRLEL